MRPAWYLIVSLVAAAAAAAAAAARSVQGWKERIAKLEAEVAAAVKQRAAERMGRIRGQRELRQALLSSKDEKVGGAAYPMTPIGIVRSCFSTRNGTPRQPMLVTLARASLVLSSKNVAAEALDGLSQYSHCWLIYVFHENTDLPGLWKQPPHRDFKAKVRVPRLEGGKMGVFATRTPHRPCPIGLSVAKVEGIHGATLLLSGSDLVDGTPVLDIKPYLPYCDSLPDASAPHWVKAGGEDDIIAMSSVDFTEAFSRQLSQCWESMGKLSLYSSWSEVQGLIKQVLSRDIRSLSQRQRPRNAVLSALNEHFLNAPVADGDALQKAVDTADSFDMKEGDEDHNNLPTNGDEVKVQRQKLEVTQDPSGTEIKNKIKDNKVVYHLVLEGIDVAYTLIGQDKVLVEGAAMTKVLKPPATKDFDSRNWRHLYSNDH